MCFTPAYTKAEPDLVAGGSVEVPVRAKRHEGGRRSILPIHTVSHHQSKGGDGKSPSYLDFRLREGFSTRPVVLEVGKKEKAVTWRARGTSTRKGRGVTGSSQHTPGSSLPP